MQFWTSFVLAAAGSVSAAACKSHNTTTTAVAPSGTSVSPTSTIDWVTYYDNNNPTAVSKAKATALTRSPTSSVKGKVFDRYVSIWFENTDFDKADADPNFQFFASKGITLTGFRAVTHPSQPNYVSVVSGDYFGMEDDDVYRIPKNISTVIDLLEDKGVSWGFYEEDMPFSGFTGESWMNQVTFAQDYMRKHNPGVSFDSNVQYEDRLAQIKNLSMIYPEESLFHQDLAANKLPQWLFVTPNMTSDAHNSDITTAGKWLKSFLAPLLDDPHFMNNTLVTITFDENETYEEQNTILTIVLGDAVPESLHGTKDDSYYNHYSEIATVEANWDLHTLGRWDVGANVFEFVGKHTGDAIRTYENLDHYYFNSSYGGNFSTSGYYPLPAPNLALNKSVSGRTILPSIMETWANSDAPTYYTDTVMNPDGMHSPAGFPSTS
ncbi:hypothetical protein TD95_002168 [Thielaviopsis punctulata]|uniref:Acid phosphatase n=1 Tax=Thielaviopsis punctulata TaxID=72032 RepID=A0A0F4Z7Y9_9PEZI|nr:hypothetical protein TD95_002168 [Thielaviopsis punctulata]